MYSGFARAKPTAREVSICLPSMRAEIDIVRPEVLVCLGAAAAQALLGRQFRITRERGLPIASPPARHVMATVHPS